MIEITRHYLTFAEVCTRWAVTPQDLHYLIAQCKVFPCALTDEEMQAYQWEGYDEDKSGTIYDLEPVIEDQGYVALTAGALLYLTGLKRTDPFSYSFQFARHERPPEGEIKLSNDTFDVWYKLNHPIYNAHVEVSCVFLLQDIEEFEAKHPKRRDKPRTDHDLTTKEKTTLLNIIGALLELHDQKDAATIDEILRKHPTSQGLKKRTLEGKFAEARRSLKAD